MEIIHWANGQGDTIKLDQLELAELETAIQQVARRGSNVGRNHPKKKGNSSYLNNNKEEE